MRRIEVRVGNIGYRNQFDRTRRFLDRVEGAHENDVAFQDMVWAFFQNCYHLRDWIKQDPLMTEAQKKAVFAKVKCSTALQRCGDLCNGTKHLVPKKTRHSHISITIEAGKPAELDCLIEVGAHELLSAKQLARECVAEWERILESEQLATTRMS